METAPPSETLEVVKKKRTLHRKPKIPYACPRCGYNTSYRNDMRRHLSTKDRPCPSVVNDIELTDEIKEHILINRIYRPPPVLLEIRADIKKLKEDFSLLQNKARESIYQRFLEKYLGGTHMKLPIGITDITTDEMHAEIKEWNLWKHALGQLIVYNCSRKRDRLCMFLFGKYAAAAKKTAVETLLQQNIEPYEVNIHHNQFTIRDMRTSEIIYCCSVDD